VRAIVQEGYGTPDVLRLRDIPLPRLGDGDVLVRVHAASVNALDWHTTRGMPYLIRLFDGLRTPRIAVRGVDLAGRVEAVGSAVTGIRPGDDVFGGAAGAFAEYAATQPARLARMPDGLGYDEAAALHIAGLTALQGLRDRARLEAGQRVLIVGAGGGVGTLAVQVARWLGAHVTGVTRTQSVDLVRSVGAHHVVDHQVEDFTRRGERYDVVFDIGGTGPLRHCRRVLTRRGTLVVVGAPAGRWLAPATRFGRAALLSPFVPQRLVPFVSKDDAADLALLAELVAAGHVRPVIDRRYPLAQAAEAVRYLGMGNPRGKVIVRIAGEGSAA
jgi:NADPH:quinone reductase-like Zn-dependent oxidoreductase